MIKNLIDFMDYFKDEETCLKFLEKRRFRNGEYCPHCNHDKIYNYSVRRLFKCAKCKKQFSIKVGTIFEGSKISLKKWFTCIHLLSVSRKGISSVQVGIQLGLPQNTAWFMVHRLRSVLTENINFFDGIVEIDETYIGGKESNKHKSKRAENTQGRSLKTKTPIIGILHRDTKQIKAIKVDNVKSSTIKRITDNSLSKETKVYTDEFRNYNFLDKEKHKIVNHSAKEYVLGDVHTNGMENFWSIFKRGYIGIYHYMSKKHLQKYIDEFTFRYNYKENYLDVLLDKSFGKRLRYKDLICE